MLLYAHAFVVNVVIETCFVLISLCFSYFTQYVVQVNCSWCVNWIFWMRTTSRNIAEVAEKCRRGLLTAMSSPARFSLSQNEHQRNRSAFSFTHSQTTGFDS